MGGGGVGHVSWWFFFSILVFISLSIQDMLCCAFTLCVIVILPFEKSQSKFAVATDGSSEVRRPALFCCSVAQRSLLPPPNIPPSPDRLNHLLYSETLGAMRQD